MNLLASVLSIIAIVLPFFIVLRWQGLGAFAAVLFGWGIIHFSNIITNPETLVGDEARVHPIFTGVWLIFGGVYMAAWCVVVALIILAFRFIKKFLFTLKFFNNRAEANRLATCREE
jgi:hypothetical protein